MATDRGEPAAPKPLLDPSPLASSRRSVRRGPAANPTAPPFAAAPLAAASPLDAPTLEIPRLVTDLLEILWEGGHSAYVVGGCVRDALLGREPADWDLTTDASPERMMELFPRALYENRFGTVVVRHGHRDFEITTFRCDVSYSDHRHPDAVEFGDSIDEDLARRDFTINAMAWGGPPDEVPAFVDPHGGREDLAQEALRAVGDPDRRFEEDALRMLRAVRLAAILDFVVESETLAAIARNAKLAAAVSGERVFVELEKLLMAPAPSIGLILMNETGLLAVIAPELARQRGMPQNKIAGEDLWDHTLRTVDAAPRRRIVRLAALLHDVGKPDALADGHFHGHETVGAQLARRFLDRLHAPRVVQERVAHLVANHMFSYEPAWTDAAIRRFLRKVGPGSMNDLLALRGADNVGSGLAANVDDLDELAARVKAELDSGAILGRTDLVIDGNDLIVDLGLAPGRGLGRLLDEITERVVAEPALNDRAILLELARQLVAAPANGGQSPIVEPESRSETEQEPG